MCDGDGDDDGKEVCVDGRWRGVDEWDRDQTRDRIKSIDRLTLIHNTNQLSENHSVDEVGMKGRVKSSGWRTARRVRRDADGTGGPNTHTLTQHVDRDIHL